jgi:hypothetical protein
VVQPDRPVDGGVHEHPHPPQVARSLTAKSRSQAAPAWPTTGWDTRRTRSTGATRSFK